MKNHKFFNFFDVVYLAVMYIWVDFLQQKFLKVNTVISAVLFQCTVYAMCKCNLGLTMTSLLIRCATQPI